MIINLEEPSKTTSNKNVLRMREWIEEKYDWITWIDSTDYIVASPIYKVISSNENI